MPVGVGLRAFAGLVEASDVLGVERPAKRAEVLAQLRFGARADDERRHARPRQQPVERDLRYRLAGFLRDFVEHIDDTKKTLIIDPFLFILWAIPFSFRILPISKSNCSVVLFILL